MTEINLFAIPPIFSGLTILYFGLSTFLKNPKSASHRAYLYLCYSFAHWLLFFSGVYLTSQDSTAYRIAQYSTAGVALIPFTNLHFTLTILNLKPKRIFSSIIWLFAVVFMIISFTPMMYSDTRRYFWGYYPIAGQLHPAFLCYFVLVWTYSIYLLYKSLRSFRHQNDYLKYNQAKYLLLGWLVCILAMVDFLPKYEISIYPIGCFIAPYWVAFTGVTMNHNRMPVDFSILTRKVVIGTVFAFTMLILFTSNYAIMEILQRTYLEVNTSLILSVASILLGLLAGTIYKTTTNNIDRLFYPEHFERNVRLLNLERRILSNPDPMRLAQSLFENLFSTFKLVRLSIFLLDERTKDYRMQSSIGWNTLATDNGNFVLSKSNCIVQYLSSHEYLTIPLADKSTQSSIDFDSLNLWMSYFKASLCMPIKKDTLLGFIFLGEKESGLPYTEREIHDIKALSDLTAIVTNSAFLQSSREKLSTIIHVLEESSNRDSMTNLYNHRKIKECLAESIEWAQSNGDIVTAVIADIDHFKAINDTYGHPVGDVVIQEFAKTLDTCIRNPNGFDYALTTGRLGGEEFLVILRGVGDRQAETICERILAVVRETDITLKEGSIKFTVSLGAAQFPKDGGTVEEILEEADRMLYRAKKEGRDRAVLSMNDRV